MQDLYVDFPLRWYYHSCCSSCCCSTDVLHHLHRACSHLLLKLLLLLLLVLLLLCGVPADVIVAAAAAAAYSYIAVLGLLLPAWAYTGLDSAEYMSEETINSQNKQPRAIIYGCVSMFVSGLGLVIAFLFAMPVS